MTCYWDEPVSGMPAPQFWDESSWVRGSDLVQGPSGSFRFFPLDWCKLFSCAPGWRPLTVLDNLLTDGGEVVSLTRRPRFTSREYSWYSVLLETE
jgi:hypothetical protein